MRYRRQAHCLWDTPLGTIPTFNSPNACGQTNVPYLAAATFRLFSASRLLVFLRVLPRFTDNLRFLSCIADSAVRILSSIVGQSVSNNADL